MFRSGDSLHTELGLYYCGWLSAGGNWCWILQFTPQWWELHRQHGQRDTHGDFWLQQQWPLWDGSYGECCLLVFCCQQEWTHMLLLLIVPLKVMTKSQSGRPCIEHGNQQQYEIFEYKIKWTGHCFLPVYESETCSPVTPQWLDKLCYIVLIKGHNKLISLKTRLWFVACLFCLFQTSTLKSHAH